eukprot:CAMPEP_0184704050 /NCGR_PEP_ID=MMETSP0313-20130426/29949_1 /TAXON_ID=2792 /ORGANISM="Porphyridium aerugineum, Strain SAG 1380-2" /LENGTH=1078 /DNA_ID=CAMNT_0027165001 /DNA_START=63 /DNA_END=3299 /DNA_ORIENTATION=+
MGGKAGSLRNSSYHDHDNSGNSMTKTSSTGPARVGPSLRTGAGNTQTSGKHSTKIHIPTTSTTSADKDFQNADPNPNFFGSGSSGNASNNHSRQKSVDDSGRRCSHEIHRDLVHPVMKSPSGNEVPQTQSLFDDLQINGEHEEESNVCQVCRDVRAFYKNPNRYVSSLVLGNTEYVKLKLKYDMDRQESKGSDPGDKAGGGTPSVGTMLRRSIGDMPLPDSTPPRHPGNKASVPLTNNEEMDLAVPRMQSSGIFKDAEEEPMSSTSIEPIKGKDKNRSGPSFQLPQIEHDAVGEEPPDLAFSKSKSQGNVLKSTKGVSSPSSGNPAVSKLYNRHDSNSPSKRICYLEFAKNFEVDYQLDKPQRLRIQLFRLIGDNHHKDDVLRDMKTESLRSARIFKYKELSHASSDDLETLRNPSDLQLANTDYELNKHELVAEASISTTSMYVHSSTEFQNSKTLRDSTSLFASTSSPLEWKPLNLNPNVYGSLMNYRFPLDAYPALLLSDHSPKSTGPSPLLLERESSTELMDVRGVLAFYELDIAARYAVFSLNIEELSIPPSVKIKDSINTVFYKTARSLSSKDKSDPNDPSIFGGTALGGYNPKWKDMVRIVVSRPLSKGVPTQWMRIHETELRAPNGGNIEFPEFRISMLRLNNGDYAREMRFELHKLTMHEGFVKVGVVTTTLVDVLRARKKKIHLAIESPDDKKRKIGVIVIRRISTMVAPSYLEYQKAGVVVSDLPLFVDFTASNQDSSLPESFHYISDPANLAHTQNEYERAMKCIYQIVSPYANHRVCPFGFGAKLPPRWQLSHCFRLIMSEEKSVACESFQHLLMSYRYGLKNCVFSGPTLFSHVVRMLRLRAERYQMFKIPIYSFAFLLAESTMSDQLDLIQELIDISGLPISIIIVGIGKASKFAALETLVRSIHPGSGYSHTLKRNMLQFVRLDDLDDTNQRTLSADGSSSSSVLANRMDDSINTEYFRPLREACAELPYQFMEYMMDADWSIDRCRLAWSASNLERHVPELWRQSGQFASIQSLVRADFELKLVNASAVFLPSNKADKERPALRLADDHIEKAGRKFKFPV